MAWFLSYIAFFPKMVKKRSISSPNMQHLVGMVSLVSLTVSSISVCFISSAADACIRKLSGLVFLRVFFQFGSIGLLTQLGSFGH